MRKILFLFSVCLLVFMTACSVPENGALSSLGEYKSKEFFTHGEFQDYTDYCIYTYETIDFKDNTYFKQVSKNDKEKLTKYTENFEKWVELFEENNPADELVVNYHFDSSLISENDYLYIYTDPNYSEFGNYDIYFFDTATNTLYYFHNNI